METSSIFPISRRHKSSAERVPVLPVLPSCQWCSSFTTHLVTLQNSKFLNCAWLELKVLKPDSDIIILSWEMMMILRWFPLLEIHDASRYGKLSTTQARGTKSRVGVLLGIFPLGLSLALEIRAHSAVCIDSDSEHWQNTGINMLMDESGVEYFLWTF